MIGTFMSIWEENLKFLKDSLIAYKVKLVASKQNPIVLLDDHGGRKLVTFLAKDLHISCLISKKNGGVLQ
jgi:phosphoribosylpyrophosphate synthetase